MFKKINLSKNLYKPDAVIFDTDNTLYEYDPANQKAEKAVERKVKDLLGCFDPMTHFYLKVT